MLKQSIASIFIEVGLTFVGIILAVVRFLILPLRQMKYISTHHLILAGAGFFTFLIGCGLLSLLGKEPFALPFIAVGVAGLIIILAKLLVTMGRIGLILIQHALFNK